MGFFDDIAAGSTIRRDRLYQPDVVLDRLDMAPDQEAVLADWRKRGVGPRWVELPDGSVRYYGFSLRELVYPVGAEAE